MNQCPTCGVATDGPHVCTASTAVTYRCHACGAILHVPGLCPTYMTATRVALREYPRDVSELAKTGTVAILGDDGTPRLSLTIPGEPECWCSAAQERDAAFALLRLFRGNATLAHDLVLALATEDQVEVWERATGGGK